MTPSGMQFDIRNEARRKLAPAPRKVMQTQLLYRHFDAAGGSVVND